MIKLYDCKIRDYYREIFMKHAVWLSLRAELANVNEACDVKTVNRVNKVAFELIISFHMRGSLRETEEEEIGCGSKR